MQYSNSRLIYITSLSENADSNEFLEEFIDNIDYCYIIFQYKEHFADQIANRKQNHLESN